MVSPHCRRMVAMWETAAVPASVLEIGQTLGPFALDAPLGGGGESEIWRATGDGLTVALKIMHDPTDGLARARLAREATALRRVVHPHVVGLLLSGDRDGEAFLALELLDGGTLADALNDGRLSPEVAAATLAPLAEALAQAHAAGVVHRDVKPANVVLAPDGPRLVDFGAAALDGHVLDGWLDGAGAEMLTPRYAAPERGAEPSVDVFSLGAVLCESVFGLSPADLATVTRGASELHDCVLDVVMQCCALVPADRLSMREVAALLRAIAADGPAASIAAAILVDVPNRNARNAIEAQPRARTGREFEVAKLLDGFDAARASNELRTTLITAPPGLGKTWLLDAAATKGATHGATVLRSRCGEAVGDVRVLASWVRRAFAGDGATSSAANLRAAVRQALGDHHASVLLHSVGLESGGGSAADAASIAESLASMLAWCAAPIAILDDLHYATDDLLNILSRLSFRSGIRGVMWLGARPGTVDADDVQAQSLRLDPLDDAVIVDLAGAEASELAGGNPLLALEIALAKQRGSDIGSDVRAMVRSRLDRVQHELSPSSWRAAACGDVFWPEVLGATDALNVLCREGIVRARVDSSVLSSTEAEWSHPLLREVAYERLSEEQRQQGHLGVALSLDRAAIDVEVVAHHAGVAFEKGADVAEFVADTAARAARSALDRFSLPNATRWTRLLASTGIDPITGMSDTLNAEIRLGSGDYEAALALAQPWTEPSSGIGGVALAVCAHAHLGLGDPHEALELGNAALLEHSDAVNRDLLTTTVAIALARLGRAQDAIVVCEAAERECRQRGNLAFAARLRARRVISGMQVAMQNGTDFTSGAIEGMDCLRELRELGDERTFAEAANDVADLLSAFDPYAAQEILDPALAAAVKLEDAVLEGRISNAALQMAIDVADTQRIQRLLPIARRLASDHRMKVEVETTAGAVELAMYGPSDAAFAAVRDAAAGAQSWVLVAALTGVTANLWFGRVAAARELLDQQFEFPFHAPMLQCAFNAVAGENWIEPDVGSFELIVANELALLAYLRGDRGRGDDLLRARHSYLVAGGSTYQRYNTLYSGALVAALGPTDIEPRRDWLIEQILTPSMPYMWIVHRAMCAMLLAERGIESATMREAASRLVKQATPDQQVSAWLEGRIGRD